MNNSCVFFENAIEEPTSKRVAVFSFFCFHRPFIRSCCDRKARKMASTATAYQHHECPDHQPSPASHVSLRLSFTHITSRHETIFIPFVACIRPHDTLIGMCSKHKNKNPNFSILRRIKWRANILCTPIRGRSSRLIGKQFIIDQL